MSKVTEQKRSFWTPNSKQSKWACYSSYLYTFPFPLRTKSKHSADQTTRTLNLKPAAGSFLKLWPSDLDQVCLQTKWMAIQQFTSFISHHNNQEQAPVRQYLLTIRQSEHYSLLLSLQCLPSKLPVRFFFKFPPDLGINFTFKSQQWEDRKGNPKWDATIWQS